MRSTYIIRQPLETRTKILAFVSTAKDARALLERWSYIPGLYCDLALGTPEEGYNIGAFAYVRKDGRIVYHHPLAATRFSSVITG